MDDSGSNAVRKSRSPLAFMAIGAHRPDPGYRPSNGPLGDAEDAGEFPRTMSVPGRTRFGTGSTTSTHSSDEFWERRRYT